MRSGLIESDVRALRRILLLTRPLSRLAKRETKMASVEEFVPCHSSKCISANLISTLFNHHDLMGAAERLLSTESTSNSERTSPCIQMTGTTMVEVELLPHLSILLRYLQMPLVVVHSLHRALTELVQLRSTVRFRSCGEVWFQIRI